jgi:glycosyltransferase involved in cell wall biosynthesis
MHSSLVGGERVLPRLLGALDPRAVTPLVVLPEPGPLEGDLDAVGAETRILPTRWWIPATHWTAGHFLAQLEGVEARAGALADLLREERIDLVHTMFLVSFEGAFAAAALGLPHVWHSRGLFGGGFPPAWFDDLPFLLSVVDALGDAVLCVSRDVARQTATGVRAEAVHVVHDGVDLDAVRGPAPVPREALLASWRVDPAARIVACVGGIQRRKGQLDLVEAGPRLLAAHPDLVLVFAGSFNDADYVAELRRRAHELGIAPRLVFTGQLGEVRSLLAASTLLVHPSHSEGFGLAIVEAMARGLPVVATRCGGPEEIVEDGISGLLVPVGSPAPLAAAIGALLSDGDRAGKLGAAARRRSDAFSLASTAAATAAVYTRVHAQAAARGERAGAAARIVDELVNRARRAAAAHR